MMKLSYPKALVGIGVSLVGALIIIPVIFWLMLSIADNALDVKRFLSGWASVIIAGGLFLIGIFWITWAYSYILFVGKGLPLEAFGRALHPTQYLVTTGPYAYTRHPMVFGIASLLLGIAVLRGSIVGVVMVPLIMLIATVYLAIFEEKALEKRFGEDYNEYSCNVPMILPRFTPYLHSTAKTCR